MRRLGQTGPVDLGSAPVLGLGHGLEPAAATVAVVSAAALVETAVASRTLGEPAD